MANYVLEILDGDRAGEVLPVGDATMRIGRKPGNDLVLADEKTSGVHCEIAPEDDRLVLRDLGSTNGTFLDGKRVTELVLTPGDVITVGRLRVCFREDGAEASAAVDGGEEFSLRKLDAARLQRRSSPVGLLLVLLLVLGGGGGYWWWTQQQQQQEGGDGGATASRRKDPLVISGNRLGAALANCEAEEGWNLRAGGLGFRAGGAAHTGAGGFAAYIAAAEEGAEAAPKSDDDYAVLQLAEPLKVFAGRTLTVTAHCRTQGAGQVALRAHCFAESEDAPFHFVHGTAAAECEDWQRLEAVVTVPAGCDRLLVEVVALLPQDDAEVQVDDVAVTEGGDKNGIDERLKDTQQSAFGFGSALAVRSTDPQNPATVLAIVPDQVPAPLRRLHAAGRGALSDVGGAVAVTAEERGFAIEVQGCDAVQLVLPAESGDSLMQASAEGAFASAGAQSEFSAARVLFGSFGTRGMVRAATDVAVRGETGGGVYRLTIATPRFEVVTGFRPERQQAGDLVRRARSAFEEGRPGQALDELARVFAEVPMDSEELGRAQELRTLVLAEQGNRVRQLQRDLEQADFFDTRGGFERVRDGVDELVALYGEANVEDLAAAKELRQLAETRLQAFDRTTFKAQRDRLTALAEAFGAAEQEPLQKLVEGYVQRNLPAVEGEGPGETGAGEAPGGGGRD